MCNHLIVPNALVLLKTFLVYLPSPPQGTFSLIIEALHTDSPDDLATGKNKPKTSKAANYFSS